MEVMTRTAAAAVQVVSRLESTRAVCDCMAAIMSGDLIPKPKDGGAAEDSLQPLTPSERLLPLSHPQASPGSQSPEWVADLLVAILQRAGRTYSCTASSCCVAPIACAPADTACQTELCSCCIVQNVALRSRHTWACIAHTSPDLSLPSSLMKLPHFRPAPKQVVTAGSAAVT